MDNSNKADKDAPTCPRGSEDCPIFEEIDELKQQVAQLGQAATTDHLTGLYNRQYLASSLEQELERTRRSGNATSLIMLDVDHFKRFNDEYGHTLGDKVLIQLARGIKASVRKLDIPCRYGGEEFAIVLPSSSITTGALVAERLRKHVANTSLSHEGDSLDITISLGIAAYYADSAETIESFIHAADQQLYAAKEAGRNCVKYKKRKRNQVQVSAEEKAALFNFDPDSSSE